jgi:DNA polymerase-3 subunit alpha/error-prone DNA polymerase
MGDAHRWTVPGDGGRAVCFCSDRDPMEFLTFEDETGIVETSFFPQAYRRFCHIIYRRRPYLLTGTVEEDWGAITLTVDQVERIMR